MSQNSFYVQSFSKYIFSILWLVSCIPSPGAADSQQTIEEGVFIFAASGDFKPFSYVDNKGTLTGFDIAVGEALARELNLKPRPQKYKFAALIEGVKSGRFDAAVASHTITEERLVHVNFSTPYYYSGPQIFIRPESDLYNDIDLKDKEIAVSKGSTYEQMARTLTKEIRIYDSDVTALEALAVGRHDAVITDFITGKEAIRDGIKVKPGKLLGRSEQAIAIDRGKTQLLEAVNLALESMRKSGELKKISTMYFGQDITTLPDDHKSTVASKESKSQTSPGFAHFLSVLIKSRGLFIDAMVLTIKLTVLSIAIGCFIGIVFAFMRIFPMAGSQYIANIYVYLIRGTPLIVQIFVLYFGLTHIVKIPGFWAASLALAVHNGAYLAEIFRGAIQSVDRGQTEAGLALGMSMPQTLRKVVLPQAGLIATPSIGNQFIICLKDSSLAAFISINELFNVATTQGANHFDQMTYLLVVALYYLVLVLLLTLGVNKLEKRLGKGVLS